MVLIGVLVDGMAEDTLATSGVTVEGMDNVIVIIVETTTAEPTKKPTNVLAGTTGTDQYII